VPRERERARTVLRGEGRVRYYPFSSMLQRKPASPASKLPRVASTLNCINGAPATQRFVPLHQAFRDVVWRCTSKTTYCMNGAITSFFLAGKETEPFQKSRCN
jgi:hypothetical protein